MGKVGQRAFNLVHPNPTKICDQKFDLLINYREASVECDLSNPHRFSEVLDLFGYKLHYRSPTD